MAWTAPITVVAEQALTASMFNQQIRDNLLITAPGMSGLPGFYWTTYGPNTVIARKFWNVQVLTSEATASSTYVDLATVGPTVDVITDTSAIVWISAEMSNSTVDRFAITSVAITGASNVTPTSTAGLYCDGKPAGEPQQCSRVYYYTGLRRGTNTFTMKYRTDGTGTGTFLNREIIVMPL